MSKIPSDVSNKNPNVLWDSVKKNHGTLTAERKMSLKLLQVEPWNPGRSETNVAEPSVK